MNYRLSTIFARKSYTVDYTEIIDLDVVDPISQLLIELAVTNGGSGAPAAHAIACLPKIELVDGSDVLFSLSGYEAEAVDIYHNKKMRSNWNPYLSGMDVQRFIAINFGRFLWDPILAFDPKKFRNPQLKLTLDIDAGGISATPNKLQVWANMFDQKEVSPIGFLMHKEVKDYARVASAHEYTDLPRDYPYRKLFLRCQRAGYEPNVMVNNIKLSEDQDKRIIINHDAETIFRNIAQDNPMLTELIYTGAGLVSQNKYCTPTTRVVLNANTWDTTAGAGEIAVYDGDGGRFKIITGTASKNVQVAVNGWMPHATWEIPFGDQLDMDDWFDVTKVGSLKADIETGSLAIDTEKIQIFLQQLRKYGAA